MHQFSRSGFTFDVSDDGPADGPVIVLLHGFPENRSSWAALTPLLVEAGFRVLAPDQRGYSPGARPTSRRSLRHAGARRRRTRTASMLRAPSACTWWGMTGAGEWRGRSLTRTPTACTR